MKFYYSIPIMAKVSIFILEAQNKQISPKRFFVDEKYFEAKTEKGTTLGDSHWEYLSFNLYWTGNGYKCRRS